MNVNGRQISHGLNQGHVMFTTVIYGLY